MSKAQPTLDDFDSADDATDDAESDESAGDKPDWTPHQQGSYSGADALECECGCPLTMWAAPVSARRYVRAFGDETAGTVPGCPGCVDWRDNDSERVESIPHAMREMETQSTVEAHDPRKLVLRHARQEAER